MPIYAINATHPATSCPIFNEEVRKKFRAGYSKKDEIGKKYKIKVLVAVVAALEHYVTFVVEAPAQPAVEEYLKEIELASFNNIRIREVAFMDDTTKRYGLT